MRTWISRTSTTAALVVAILVSSTACTDAAPERSVPPPVAVTAKADGTNTVEKVVVFVVENRSQEQMRNGLPWVRRLGDRYGHTTDYHGIRHPSLPNYLAMLGGSTFGIEDDGSPAAHPLTGPSVLGEAVAAGSTARVYAESMTSRCQTTSTGRYAVRHNPWAYFEDEASLCAKDDVKFARFARDVTKGRLPSVGLVIPNLCHDAHDCRLSVANTWLKGAIKQLLKGPDWKSGHLAIVVTADEDDGDHDNQIFTVVAHPYLDGVVVDDRLDHYSLSRSFAEVAGVDPLREAADTTSLLAAFGLS